MSDLRRIAAGLQDAVRDVLELKALAGGMGASLLRDCLNEAHSVPPKGRTWTALDYRGTLNTLQTLGLITPRGRAAPELEHELSLSGLRFAPALHRVLDRGSGGHTLGLRLRLAVYERDEAAYIRGCIAAEQYDPGAFSSQFRDVPLDAGWLAALPARMALDILSGNLVPLIESGTVTPGLPSCLTMLDSRRNDFLTLPPRLPLALFDTLSGRFREAREQIVPLLQDRTRFEGVLVQGVLTFLEGGDGLPMLLEARKRFRRASGRRKAMLPGIGGLCLALALIRSDDPAQHDACAAMLESISLREPCAKGLTAARVLLGRVNGHADAAALSRMAPLPSDPLSEAVFYAVDASLESGTHDTRGARNLFDRYERILPLVACLLAETLAHFDPSFADRARAFGIPHVRITDFLDSREDWERAFETLVHRLQQPQASAVKRRRLAWLLDMEHFQVTALEQSAKGDGWTSGRTASLKRLHDEAGTLDWLEDQDKAVLALLRWSRTWSGLSCELDPRRAFPVLAGHPHLLRAQDHAAITLTCKPVELMVRETGNGYSLSLSRWMPSDGMQCVETEPCAYVLYFLPEALEGAAEVLGRDGLRVPAEGGPRVLELVRSLDDSVVHPVINAAATPAELRLVVRLRPLGTGIEASLLVRPFGTPDTPAFPVGEGPESPLAESGGHPMRTRRDFAAEEDAARELVRSCRTLREPGGTGPWELTEPEDALDCLLELEQSGIEMEWPEGERLKVTPQVPSSRLAVDARHSRDWFQLRGELRINESLVISMAQVLEHLREAKGRFIPLGDGAFLALTKQFRQQLDRLARMAEPDGEGVRVHPLAAESVRDLLDGAELHGDEAWEAQLRRFASMREGGGTPAVPPTLRAELRDYQLDGYVWLSRLARLGAGAILADDMGLGKTVQTIALLLAEARSGPSLIIAPTSVCHNWESELARFAPTLRVLRFGPGDRKAQVASLEPGDILIASYGLLHTEAACLAGRRWTVAVFDEAQALKNAETRRARASRRIPADFRLALTGTPIENRLEDLWSLFNLITPGLLGTRQSFQKRFGFSVPAPGEALSQAQQAARQALRLLVRPFILRRTKTDVLSELPPRTEQILDVELPDEERAFYEAMRRAALASLDAKEKEDDGKPGKFHILAELTRLRRACCVPSLVDPKTILPGAKLQAFMDLVGELVHGGHKALVFSQFVGCLTEARKRLDAAGYAYQYLDGSTPDAERQRAVSAFQSGSGDLFLISLKAGGQGLNLTAADYVIHLDPWWNPAVEDQASDRAYRIGQQRPVTVYRLIARGTVEEAILHLHRAKRALAGDLLEGADVPLSEAELLDLIRR